MEDTEVAQNTLFDLTGDVAIITGASRGLGLSHARALANAGADLVITARSVESLKPIREEIQQKTGRTVLALPLDVCNYDSIRKMVEDAHAAFGKIDILINNAGRNLRKPSLEITWDDWDAVLDTNLKGSFFVAQAAAEKMKERSYGRIVNTGSATCMFGYAGVVPYCASRGGIKQMTMGLADDWAPYGINVNCLAPGWFITEQNKLLFEDREWVEGLQARIPQRRIGIAGDLDGAVVFLSSRACDYLTGQTIFVDGGYTSGSIKAMGKK